MKTILAALCLLFAACATPHVVAIPPDDDTSSAAPSNKRGVFTHEFEDPRLPGLKFPTTGAVEGVETTPIR